jgi:hypothetical protein
MDLDSRAQYKLVSEGYSDINFEEYRRILEALCPLGEQYDHETPEMWCSHIRDLFRKIFEENLRILSKNGYITMYRILYKSDRYHGLPTNYIYCSVCDFLVFISENSRIDNSYRDNYLKSCINRDTISKEHARRKDILQSIDKENLRSGNTNKLY